MKLLISSFTSIALTLLLSLGVQADQKFTCMYGDSVREIHVVYVSPDSPVPCSVQYKKDDSLETLWSAEAEIGYCEEKAQAFINKQQGWGWECSQDAGDVMSVDETSSTDMSVGEMTDQAADSAAVEAEKVMDAAKKISQEADASMPSN